MKKIYDRRVLVKVDGWEEFEDTSIFRCLRYKDEDFVKQEYLYRFRTFEDMKAEIEEGCWILDAEVTTTFFTRQPKIKINTVNSLFHCSPAIEMTKKNFKPIEVRCAYNKMSASMKELSEALDSDSFCEYLKDRGITKIWEKFLKKTVDKL